MGKLGIFLYYFKNFDWVVGFVDLGIIKESGHRLGWFDFGLCLGFWVLVINLDRI